MRSPISVLQEASPPAGLAASRATAIGTACIAIALAAALLIPFRAQPEPILLASAVIVLCITGFLQVRSLQLARERFLLTRRSLDLRHHEFHSVFDGALDAILILDDKLICREANPAAATLLGVDRQQLVGRSMGRFFADSAKPWLLGNQLPEKDSCRGKMEMMRADGARIVAEFSSSPNMLPSRHLLILRDSTAELRANEARTRSLAVARSNFLETQALRNATLTLTRSVRMNPVLDTLLKSLYPLIPYDTAQVLLLETPGRLFLVREVSSEFGNRLRPEPAETFDSGAFPVLMRTLEQRRGVLVSDTRHAGDWHEFPAGIMAGSWLGVPLYIGEEAIGILSLAHSRPAWFGPEHLRLASSLAIPVSLAIRNARLHERGEIFRAELQQRLSNPQRADN